MNVSSNPAVTPRATAAMPPSRLMVLLFTDVVGSVDLKNRIGTTAYAAALAKHDALFRRLILMAPGAEILTDTGDGFFACFSSASDAVRTALLFQQLVSKEAQPLKVRIGLHVGEVTQVSEGGERPKVIGLAADFASRLTRLAGASQILLTRFPFNEARQFIGSHPQLGEEAAPEISWVAHGEYLFKGSSEAMEVFEVGAPGLAPLAPPSDNDAARRAVRPGDELTLGWRPAGGLEIPSRPHWVISDKLGEGGFGEVWLAEHDKTRMRRVFKFCFDSHRLRGLKREVVLFRLLKDVLGDRRDIARVTDYQFDDSPYFIEYEYFPGGTLSRWATSVGGIEKLPLALRIRLVAQIADALAAAHSVGVLHKDVKPSNVLIATAHSDSTDLDEIFPVLTDFGIGILTDETQLQRHDITALGFTQATITANDSSRTGTRLYAPPESLVDRPYTVQGDIFALGVMLYQMVVGDLERPLATGWQRDIDDPLLRDDIEQCVQGDPARRLSSAKELADRLNRLSERRAELEQSAASARAMAQRKYLMRAAVTLILIAGVLGASLLYVVRQRNVARYEAAKANAMVKFFGGILSGADANQARRKDVTVAEVLDAAAPQMEVAFKDKPQVEAPLRFALGNSYIGLGMFPQARPQLERSVELFEKYVGESADAAKAVNSLGAVYQNTGDYAKAEATYQKALAMRRKLAPESAEVGDTLWNLAIIAYYTNQPAKAQDYLRQSLAVREKVLGPESIQVAAILQLLGMLEGDRGNIAESEKLQLRSLAIREKALGPEHPFVAEVLTGIGELYLRKRDYTQAEQTFNRALKIFEKNLPADHPHIGITLTKLAGTYCEMGQFERALPLAQRALEITERQLGKENEATLGAANALAMVYQGKGDFAQAETLNRRAVEGSEKGLGPDHPWTLRAKTHLARTLLFQNKADEAEKILESVKDGMKKTGDTSAVAICDGLLIEVVTRRGEFEKAESLAQEYYKRMQSFEPLELRGGLVANAADVLTHLYEAWNKPEQAAKYRALSGKPASQPATQATTQPTTQPTTGS